MKFSSSKVAEVGHALLVVLLGSKASPEAALIQTSENKRTPCAVYFEEYGVGWQCLFVVRGWPRTLKKAVSLPSTPNTPAFFGYDIKP